MATVARTDAVLPQTRPVFRPLMDGNQSQSINGLDRPLPAPLPAQRPASPTQPTHTPSTLMDRPQAVHHQSSRPLMDGPSPAGLPTSTEPLRPTGGEGLTIHGTSMSAPLAAVLPSTAMMHHASEATVEQKGLEGRPESARLPQARPMSATEPHAVAHHQSMSGPLPQTAAAAYGTPRAVGGGHVPQGISAGGGNPAVGETAAWVPDFYRLNYRQPVLAYPSGASNWDRAMDIMFRG